MTCQEISDTVAPRYEIHTFRWPGTLDFSGWGLIFVQAQFSNLTIYFSTTFQHITSWPEDTVCDKIRSVAVRVQWHTALPVEQQHMLLHRLYADLLIVKISPHSNSTLHLSTSYNTCSINSNLKFNWPIWPRLLTFWPKIGCQLRAQENIFPTKLKFPRPPSVWQWDQRDA